MAYPGIVVFDYSTWSARYPELAAFVSGPIAQAYFDEAGMYLSNSPCSVVSNETGKRAVILNMITAHIAALNAPLNGQPSSPLVGRIDNAVEGSVNVHADYQASQAAAWWLQTKYGAAAWQALLPYRSGRYVTGPPQQLNGFGFRPGR